MGIKMSLFNMRLEKITLENIQSLIDEKVYESLYLEYKRELTFVKDRNEFLYDLTAMANSEGGNLIYGIEECQGYPYKIIGIEVSSIDKLQQQIENTLRDCITPPMKYDLKFIKTNENEYMIIFDVQKSTNAPHMVTAGGHGFYKRNLSGKHKMNVNELRECFMTSAGFSKEAYLYHLKDEFEYNKEALGNIESYLTGNTPVPSAFEAMSIGSTHIRLQAWDAIVRAGILPMLSSEVIKAIQDADKSIRKTIRIIQMQNAHWKQSLEYDDYVKDKHIPRFPMKEVHRQISGHLSENLQSSLKHLNSALDIIYKENDL